MTEGGSEPQAEDLTGDPQEALDDLFARLGIEPPPPTPGVNDATYPARDDLLVAVIDHYLTSRDFNGLPVGQSDGPHANAEGLIRDGLVQLVTDTDFLNVHIRPWAKDDVERQAAELHQVAAGTLGGCLYPTPSAMQQHKPDLTQQPYLDRRILGQATFDLVFFDLAAIERYRSDPTYDFQAHDFGFRISSAPAHADDTAYEDLIAFEAGYAYDYPADYKGDEPLHRYWCACLYQLAELPANDQIRLATDEVTGPTLYQHPEWWANLMGHWGDVLGPFTKILSELDAINEVWTIAFGKNLFRTTERPRGWSWVLRPTTGEWNDFVLTTDKLLSDNISTTALDAANAPTTDAAGKDLPPTATLSRLQGLLAWAARNQANSEKHVQDVMKPLRDVRKARQKPAHSLSDTAFDHGVINAQRDLLRNVARSLDTIRYFLQSHPKVQTAEWKPSDYLERDWLWL